jgi:ABC-type transporter Mla maintaining outer membrane lipid asymmetry permease subunit MlaE
MLRERARDLVAPFAVVPRILGSIPLALSMKLRDFAEVMRVVVKQTLLRPTPFFAIVSTLIGYSVLYIFHRSFTGGDMPLRNDKVFELIGSRHIIALVPPLSGILFAATSGNAITAWLGGISLTRQSTALRALGVPEHRYLWTPAWLGLTFSFLCLAALFTAGMVLGGTVYVHGVEHVAATWQGAYEIVTAQLLDPTQEERRLLVRAGVLLAIYSVGIGADAIAKGAKEKETSESVTVSMVRNVMACTLWIVALELVSLPFVLGDS